MKYEFTVYIQVECKLTATVNLLSKLLASQLPAILTVKLRSYFLQCGHYLDMTRNIKNAMSMVTLDHNMYACMYVCVCVCVRTCVRACNACMYEKVLYYDS